LVRPDLEDLLEGLELFRASDALGAFDAILAVAARRRGCALASADDAFGEVRGLVHLNPASPTFLEAATSVR
jgi:predicted nucleic acid-binding protein